MSELRVLTIKQVQKLLSTPNAKSHLGKRDRAFLAVMVLGGLRIAEACNLRVDDVHVEDDVTRLTFTGKGHKQRTVTLPIVAAHYLHEAMPDTLGITYVFHGNSATKPLTTRGGRFIVSQVRDAAGLPAWVHPHSLRHTYATMLMRATKGDLFTVARTLGHSNINTTARHYSAWDVHACDRAAKALEGAFT